MLLRRSKFRNLRGCPTRKLLLPPVLRRLRRSNLGFSFYYFWDSRRQWPLDCILPICSRLLCFQLVPSSFRTYCKYCPAQVASCVPRQDMTPLTFMQNGVCVSSELWDYWHDSFPWTSIVEMCAFVMDDIDDEHTEFVRSLTWQGPHSPVQNLSLYYAV